MTPEAPLRSGIGFSGDHDWVAVQLQAGVAYQFDAVGIADDGDAAGLLLLDPILSLRDAALEEGGVDALGLVEAPGAQPDLRLGAERRPGQELAVGGFHAHGLARGLALLVDAGRRDRHDLALEALLVPGAVRELLAAQAEELAMNVPALEDAVRAASQKATRTLA